MSLRGGSMTAVPGGSALPLPCSASEGQLCVPESDRGMRPNGLESGGEVEMYPASSCRPDSCRLVECQGGNNISVAIQWRSGSSEKDRLLVTTEERMCEGSCSVLQSWLASIGLGGWKLANHLPATDFWFCPDDFAVPTSRFARTSKYAI